MSNEFGWIRKVPRAAGLLNMAQNIHDVWNFTSSRSLTRVFPIGFYLILYTYSMQFYTSYSSYSSVKCGEAANASYEFLVL